MPSQSTSSDNPSWRRPVKPNAAPQPVPAHAQRDHQPLRKNHDKPRDNWRAHAHPVVDPSNHHSDAKPRSISTPYSNSRPHGPSCDAEPSLLASSLRREQATTHDADWALRQHSDNDHPSAPAIKPSGIGSGVIGRAPEFGTSPTVPKGLTSPAARHYWPLSSSLEKSHSIAPATTLHPLRIEPTERSRFFPSAPIPHKFNQNGQQPPRNQHIQLDKNRDDNWMLTPTSSLPSIPNTPNRVRESSTERLLAADGRAEAQLSVNGRPPPSIRESVDHLPAQSAPRTSSPGFVFGRQEGALTGPSLFNRGPSVHVLASPKRSPLVAPTNPQRQQAGASTANTVLISPVSSPRLAHRTLSPMTRHTPAVPDSLVNGERMVNSIASLLSGASPHPRPASVSRRESFNSVTSAGPAHSMSHSRRSSAVLSPNSPALSTRIGVYRPPHLRNQDSVSGLKSSVAHYDRVRTPSLRGLSRSRESSVSLSRPTSRPPSTIPFYHNETIPEDDQVDDALRTPVRGRQSSMSIHLPDLIAEEQQRNAAVAATTESEDGRVEFFAPNTSHLLEQPLDSASLLAKLRAQLVRREAAASDIAASDMDRISVATDDTESDFFDLSEMMEYGASEGHLLSRHASSFAMKGRPPGDVFEIGDLLGPGLEHDGHVMQIAETTPGFVDQNADLTGSKLEVVRKLGEGSYAVVYLVKEVSAEEAASQVSERSMSIPSSASRSEFGETASQNLGDDADLTMVASSDEDLLSSTLKADGTGKGDGFHNSPALEQRRRKDLKVNTTLRPGREFALKCLCKRDLPEDMLEVQRLEATIHQSIPAHPNIVTLYRTYETPDWLFLVLEYCPGQDLYYWLEQAQDSGQDTHGDEDPHDKTFVGHDDVDAKSNGSSKTSDDGNYEILGSSLDATPPSPSILASTSGRALLSKRRIRLIARMFRQICDAVQFCHDRGVSHRDLKPENFIVEDRRTPDEMQSACPDTSISTLVDSTRDGDETTVIVKMTDFGLATADERCDDFDCGSKPYMAFECHNNVSSSYDPKQADIWSLGVVLLNLLFHRSPFTEPSLECASFAAYCEDPIRFLMESFDGLTETVARFLAENVFCSITDSDDAAQKRVSAGDFSRWACGLVDHMGLSRSGPGRMSRGASVYATIPLMHSRTGSMSTLPSMLSSPRPRARSLARGSEDAPDLDSTADGAFRAAFAAAAVDRQRSLSPYPDLFTPDVLPSPTFTPLPHPSERNPFDMHYAAVEAAESDSVPSGKAEQAMRVNGLENKDTQSSNGTANAIPRDAVISNDVVPDHDGAATIPREAEDKADAARVSSKSDADMKEGINGMSQTEGEMSEMTQEALDRTVGTDGRSFADDEAGHEDAAEGDPKDSKEDGDKADSVVTSNHSKRRKRGARKGRTLAKQLKRSQSVDGMADADDPAAKARERERTIRELAQASESLARQMSKMTKPSDVIDGSAPPQITLSKPTAEAAARYSLQGLAEADTEPGSVAASIGLTAGRGTKASDEAAGVSASGLDNWSSAAVRRDRMSKTGNVLLADAGRSRVMSWRERNQSAATLSSLTSSTTTISSHSSLTSATSSIYSTASAPAALTRKDFSARNRTRGSGFGLDTISEREKAGPTKKEVDAKYLAGIFGGGDGQSRKDAVPAASRSGEGLRSGSIVSAVHGADAPAPMPAKVEKGSKFFGLLSDSTSSLQRAKEDSIGPAPVVAPTTGNGSSSLGSGTMLTAEEADAGDAAAAAKAPKKRGMGKFLLGVRDSIKNF